MTDTDRIARIRIALQDIEPEIWPRVEVPLDINLKSLHDVIQAAMGWDDEHLFEFHVADKVYGFSDPEWGTGALGFGPKVLQARLAKLEAVVAQRIDAFAYVYDMGDDWEHVVEIEAIAQAEADVKYPRFIDGARRCPPEDIGGASGYYNFLKAISNRRHREHRNMLEWYGGPYDPNEIDVLTAKLRLGAIAKRRHAGKISQQKRIKAR